MDVHACVCSIRGRHNFRTAEKNCHASCATAITVWVCRKNIKRTTCHEIACPRSAGGVRNCAQQPQRRCAATVCDESASPRACSPKRPSRVCREPHFFPRANGQASGSERVRARNVDVLLNDIKNTFISIQYMRAHFVVFVVGVVCMCCRLARSK